MAPGGATSDGRADGSLSMVSAAQPTLAGTSAAAAPIRRRVPGPILLVLPRSDHVRGYAPLARALARAGDPGAVIVSGAPASEVGVPYHVCPFYRNAGAARGWRWLRFVAARERAARRLLRTLRPAAVVVPSDVADGTAPFVARAQAAGIPLVYVQGAVVFPDYPRRNAATYASQSRLRGLDGRLMVRATQAILAATGIHAVLDEKRVLGSRCDLALVMNEGQRDIHLAAGVSSERLRVTGAPFVDALVALRDGFSDADLWRVRQAVGAPAGPLVVFLTKSLFRLGWTSREVHDQVVRDVVGAVRRELPGWTCVVKLHPTEAPADYESLVGGDSRVIVTVDAQVEPLLLASDLVLSLGTSSPAFAARVFGRPLILVNFTATEMLDAHTELTATVPTCRTSRDLRATLRAIAADPTARRRLVVADGGDTWRDGGASARAAACIREVAAR